METLLEESHIMDTTLDEFPDTAPVPRLMRDEVDRRLSQVRVQIHKATQDFAQRLDPMLILKAGESAANDDNGDNNLTRSRHTASFHLGMELFGSEIPVLERKVQEGLRETEGRLEQTLRQLSLESEDEEENNDDNAMDITTDDAGVDHGKDGNETRSMEELQRDGRRLRAKLIFLKNCSLIRELASEAATLSNPALTTELRYAEAARRLVRAEHVWSETYEMIYSNHKKENEEPVDSWPLKSQPPPSSSSSTLAKAQFMLTTLRHEIRNPRVALLDRCKEIWKDCITVEVDSVSVRGYKEPNNLLSQAFDVLEIFDAEGHTLLQELLLPLCHKIHEEIISIIFESHRKEDAVIKWTIRQFEERSAVSSVLSVVATTASVKGPVRRLEWFREEVEDGKSEEHSDPSQVGPWRGSIELIQRLFEFFADHVLLARPRLCEIAGKRFLGKPSAIPESFRLKDFGLESFRLQQDDGIVMDPLVDAMVETCVPACLKPDELVKLSQTKAQFESFVAPFLDSMRQRKLLPTEKSRLEEFLEHFEKKYVELRHGLKLFEARTMILENDYHNTVRVGVDVQNDKDKKFGLDRGMDVFVLASSSISGTAEKLLQLCRECLDEAVEHAQVHHPRESALSVLPATLYRCSREILDLYRMIVPVRHYREIQDDPRMTAVYYNDCLYFSHHCLALGLEYKEKLPAFEADGVTPNVLRKICMFVDKVPLFRDMAESCSRNMFSRHAKQIDLIVSDEIKLLGRALRSDEILAEWTDAEMALDAGVRHIRQLATTWKPVFSYSVFRTVISYLSDVLLSLFLDQILEAKDFSAEGCEFTHRLLDDATQKVKSILVGDVEVSRVLSRVTAVGKFMDMTLGEVEMALTDGVFRDLSSQELTMLINATFDTSPGQRRVLAILAKH